MAEYRSEDASVTPYAISTAGSKESAVTDVFLEIVNREKLGADIIFDSVEMIDEEVNTSMNTIFWTFKVTYYFIDDDAETSYHSCACVSPVARDGGNLTVEQYFDEEYSAQFRASMIDALFIPSKYQ